MNREILGHVTVNERVPSEHFHRFVDEKIKEWLITQNLEASRCEYEVSFFDEDPLGEISCLIIIKLAGSRWRAWESADNPKSALHRSLEHLHEQSNDTTDELAASLASERSKELQSAAAELERDKIRH